MIDKLAGTMHVFGILFLIEAIILAIAAYIAALSEEQSAADLAKGLFKRCLFYGLLLWFLAWLII